jgi:hypothetical protein
MAIAFDESAERQRCHGDRGFGVGVDAVVPGPGRLHARVRFHPRLSFGVAADEESRLQAGDIPGERSLHRLDRCTRGIGSALVNAIPDEKLAHVALDQDAAAASSGTA